MLMLMLVLVRMLMLMLLLMPMPMPMLIIALRSVIALVRLQHAISDRSRLDRVKSNS